MSREAPLHFDPTAVRILRARTLGGVLSVPFRFPKRRLIYPGAEGEAPVVAEWVSGKEAEKAVISFATPDGNIFTYDASGLKAFEGQLARAQVESELAGRLAELWENVAPEIKTGLVDAVCLFVTKAPCT